MITHDPHPGLWLYSHSTGRPGRIAHGDGDLDRVNEHLGARPPRDRPLTGPFDPAAAAARDPFGGPLEHTDPDDLTPVVFPARPDGAAVVVYAPGTQVLDDSARIGTLFGRHGHLVATLAELTGGPVGVPGWVEHSWVMAHTGHPDVYVNLSYEERAHADLTVLAADLGRVLRYPARPSRQRIVPAPPYTAEAGTTVTWDRPPRPGQQEDLSGFPHLTALAGAPQRPPRLGDVLGQDPYATWYVPIDDVPWQGTSCASAVISHRGAGFDVLAATHPPTGAWVGWVIDRSGNGHRLDDAVHHGDRPLGELSADGWGTRLDLPGPPVYLVLDGLAEIDEDGHVHTVRRVLFTDQHRPGEASTRMLELSRARARAARARDSYVRRAAALGIPPAVADLFDPLEVFLRDRWECALCAGPVDPHLLFPDPGAATLDHRTPVAVGGPHTRGNTQLAHWGCNLAKGDRPAP